eukprot:jgi/Picre1/32903/NNA_008232.t1
MGRCEARVPSRIRRKNDIDAFLKMFERKESQDKGLASEEVKAVCSFLALNVDEFALLGRHDVQIKTLVHTGTLLRDQKQRLRGHSLVLQVQVRLKVHILIWHLIQCW